MDRFGHENFTDAPQNLGFTVLGWLAGKDFGDSICIAENCGQDTDCTGASLGALPGIIEPDSIPEKWKLPISEELLLSSGMKNMNPSKTIEALTDLTVLLAEEMLESRSKTVRIGDSEQVADTIEFNLNPFEPEPANSMLLTAGRHRLEVSLQFKCDNPHAALIFGDAHSHLLIHDFTICANIDTC